MTELTNLEICKSLAAIECVKVTQRINFGELLFLKNDINKIFNPLTDDALCFRFCYQDNISVSYTECPAGTGKAYYASKDGNTTDYQATPNMAVCLAKIGIFEEAHNE